MGWLRRDRTARWEFVPHELPTSGNRVEIIRDREHWLALEHQDVTRAMRERQEANPHDELLYPVGDELEFEFDGRMLVRIDSGGDGASPQAVRWRGEDLEVALVSLSGRGASVLNLDVPAARTVHVTLDGRPIE